MGHAVACAVQAGNDLIFRVQGAASFSFAYNAEDHAVFAKRAARLLPRGCHEPSVSREKQLAGGERGRKGAAESNSRSGFDRTLKGDLKGKAAKRADGFRTVGFETRL